jgi:hypothetical protein
MACLVEALISWGRNMTNDYFFRYLFPPGATSISFGDAADQILREGNIPHEIRRKDWGTFVAYRVFVPKSMERKAAFRLFSFAEFLRSQGPVSTHNVAAPVSYWSRRMPIWAD